MMNMHPALELLPRRERREALAKEAKARKTGDWGKWESFDGTPPSRFPDGWLRSVKRVHRNRVFAVLERPLAGGVRHFAITSLSTIRPTWWEMQRIKNELAGEHATAVEGYPPQGEVVDGADMFHLWILVDALPFSLSRRLAESVTCG